MIPRPRPCRHAGQSGVLFGDVRRNFRFNLNYQLAIFIGRRTFTPDKCPAFFLYIFFTPDIYAGLSGVTAGS